MMERRDGPFRSIFVLLRRRGTEGRSFSFRFRLTPKAEERRDGPFRSVFVLILKADTARTFPGEKCVPLFY